MSEPGIAPHAHSCIAGGTCALDNSPPLIQDAFHVSLTRFATHPVHLAAIQATSGQHIAQQMRGDEDLQLEHLHVVGWRSQSRPAGHEQDLGEECEHEEDDSLEEKTSLWEPTLER
eukprot:3322371-Rhodomonas_salina.3